MAEYFKKFSEIDKEYLFTDKHIHTVWCDGSSTMSEFYAKAKSLGIRQIAFTGHIRSTSTYYEDYLKEIEAFSAIGGVEVLAGFESKIADFQGCLDVAPEVLKRAKIRIASVHRFPMGRKLIDPKDVKAGLCQEIEAELTVAAIKKGNCNVIGHVGAMSLKAHGDFHVDYFEEIITMCALSGVAFELNYSYHMPVFDRLKDILKRHDPYVSMGSDAHHVNELGGWMKYFKERNLCPF